LPRVDLPSKGQASRPLRILPENYQKFSEATVAGSDGRVGVFAGSPADSNIQARIFNPVTNQFQPGPYFASSSSPIQRSSNAFTSSESETVCEQFMEPLETSSGQTNPTSHAISRVGESDRTSNHIEVEDFCKSLNEAAKAAFPSRSMSRYSSVDVLLLRWEQGDSKLPVEAETDELGQIFSGDYGFEVSIGLIPNDGPQKWLMRKMLDFIEVGGDSPDVLKIVHYHGHSFLDDDRQSSWSR
jgi:hypothetical protein